MSNILINQDVNNGSIIISTFQPGIDVDVHVLSIKDNDTGIAASINLDRKELLTLAINIVQSLNSTL